MIFVPRKKIITSPFRQRGNIVSLRAVTPPSDFESAFEYILSELSNSMALPGLICNGDLTALEFSLVSKTKK